MRGIYLSEYPNIPKEFPMPLYIKDQDVTHLAADAVKILGAANKTEAVRQALQSAIATAKGRIPLLHRIEAVRALADTIGPVMQAYDHKRDMDDLWER
jgi:antitoxin VapB